MIQEIDEALKTSIFAGITMPASQFIASTNLQFVWYNGSRHKQLRLGGVGPYGSIQELGDVHDPSREPPKNARMWKHKTGSGQATAVVAPFPEPRIYTYQINLWAEHRRGMSLAREAFMRAVPKRLFQAITVEPYGDGETETVKTFVTRDDGNVIDSLEQPRHSEWTYTVTVRGWMFKNTSSEVATFQRFVMAFATVPLKTTTIADGSAEILLEIDRDYT